MRFFAAAMARRAKDAIRRASVSTKPSRSAPGSARLIYPYRSAVIAVEVIAAEDDFEGAAAADHMWEAFRTAAGMHSHSDFRLAQSRVFARREAHITGQDEFAAHATDAVSDLRDADHRRLGEPARASLLLKWL